VATIALSNPSSTVYCIVGLRNLFVTRLCTESWYPAGDESCRGKHLDV